MELFPLLGFPAENGVHLVALFLRQRKNVQRIAVQRIANIRQDSSRHIPGAAAAEACRDGDVLFAADAERYRKSLHRRPQANLPERFTGTYVNGAEVAINIAHKGQATVS